jgi:large subunit ribosomal protein L31
MRKGIHPDYKTNVEVSCICGETHTIHGATVEGPIKVESCPACNTRYTGEVSTKVVKGRRQRYLDKLEKMKKLQGKA